MTDSATNDEANAASHVAEVPASLSNLALANVIANTNLSQQNAVSFQQAMNQVTIAVTGKAVDLISTLEPMEAVSVVKLATGNDLEQQVRDLEEKAREAVASEK